MPPLTRKPANIDIEQAKLPIHYKSEICQIFANNGITDADQVHAVLDQASIRYRSSVVRRARRPRQLSSSRNDIRPAAAMLGRAAKGKSYHMNQFLALHAEALSCTIKCNPTDALVEGIRCWETFEYVLETIASAPRSSSNTLMQSDKAMTYKISRGTKHPERFYLWEPIFTLWQTGDRRTRFSRSGPIMKILKALHAGLQLDPPNPDTVRDAVKGWQRKTSYTTEQSKGG
jgi:hypothetical protein